jgi:hypothetical protein
MQLRTDDDIYLQVADIRLEAHSTLKRSWYNDDVEEIDPSGIPQ